MKPLIKYKCLIWVFFWWRMPLQHLKAEGTVRKTVCLIIVRINEVKEVSVLRNNDRKKKTFFGGGGGDWMAVQHREEQENQNPWRELNCELFPHWCHRLVLAGETRQAQQDFPFWHAGGRAACVRHSHTQVLQKQVLLLLLFFFSHNSHNLLSHHGGSSSSITAL